jgi:hypothetical protein
MNRFILKSIFIKIYIYHCPIFFLYKNKKSKLCFGYRVAVQNDLSCQYEGSMRALCASWRRMWRSTAASWWRGSYLTISVGRCTVIKTKRLKLCTDGQPCACQSLGEARFGGLSRCWLVTYRVSSINQSLHRLELHTQLLLVSTKMVRSPDND